MQLIPNLAIIPVGMVIGMLVAAPIGPVNVLCVHRAIERGFWGGLAAGAGAVLGDGLIALLASLGVEAVSGAIEHHRFTIQLIGGLVIVLFGIKLYLSPAHIRLNADAHKDARFWDYISDTPQTFLMAIANPGSVLGLFAIFGAVGTFVDVHTRIDALALVASVMAGSILWWIGLSALVGRLRHRLNAERLTDLNRLFGIALIGFGVLLWAQLLWRMR